jgi:hypothetical protein
MMFSRRYALALLLTLSLTACGSVSLPSFKSEPEVERNILTGLPGANGEVFAVKFDDTKSARPQKGVESADVVFITQVEAGLTRLMGIYTSSYPTEVGPVRSARISDIDILAQFGRVGFMYSGAQTKMRPVLAAANIVNLSAERNPPTIYVNDPARNAPYSMMVRMPELIAKSEGVDSVKSVGWSHGEISPFAVRIDSVKMTWPNATYEAIWQKKTDRFLLNFNGEPNLGVDGSQLGSPMMVIQLVEIVPSEFGDKFGGITPKSKVVGSGVAYLLRDGTMTKATWSRADAESPTEWSLPDGSTANFALGQVWVFLTDREPTFTFPPPPESK